MSKKDTQTTLVDSTRLGVVILSGFSIVWLAVLVGFSSLDLIAKVAIAVLGLGLAVAAITSAFRSEFDDTTSLSSTPADAATRQKVFIITNIVQAVLFSIAISVCLALAAFNWIPAIGAVIVGLHFLPLAYIFREQAFFIVGTIMAVSGGVGLTLMETSSLNAQNIAASVGLISAAALLVAAFRLLRVYGSRAHTLK